MKETIKDWAILALALALVALAAVVGEPACTPKQRADAKTALKVADETCDVLVLLEEEATWVCVPVDKLEGVARHILADKHAVRVELPDGPGVRPVRSVVLSGSDSRFEVVDKPPTLRQVEAGDGSAE